MAKRYTVKMRDPGGTWCFVEGGLTIAYSAANCTPLTLAEARKARKLMIEGAAKLGRTIECKVVTLVRPGTPKRLIVLEKTLARYLKP